MSGGTWQTGAALLGIVAAVLIGAIIVVLLADQPPPAPTASPGAVAGFSPSPSPSATSSTSPMPTTTATVPPTDTPAPATAAPTEPPATAPPTAGPTATQAATAAAPTAGGSPTAVATAAPTATVVAGAPAREIRFTNLGIDAPDAEGATERYVTFTTAGPGQISAALSNVSAGRVRICLWRGTRSSIDAQECRDVRSGGLERVVTDAGTTQWTVSLIGATEQVSPNATLGVRFNSPAPSVTVDRFRFAGREFSSYNGFVAEVSAAADGELSVDANWDNPDDERFPYEMVVQEIGSSAPPFYAEGSVTTATLHAAPVVAGRSYRASFANTVSFAEAEVFLRATLSWP